MSNKYVKKNVFYRKKSTTTKKLLNVKFLNYFHQNVHSPNNKSIELNLSFTISVYDIKF